VGGTLYQDLLTDTPITVKHKNDSVDIVENTPLHQLIGKNNMFVNSFHHQAVKDVGKGLKVMAISPDGIIEGTYLDSDRYVRAYQWHPERLVDTSEENHLLFVDFINACKK
jgi:putative glutamine amidotransferase